MDKAKIIPIIFLVIVIAMGLVAFMFYSEKNKLTDANKKLEVERGNLIEERDALQNRYNGLEREKNEVDDKRQKAEEELSRIQRERDDLQKRYDDLTRQRDELVEKLKSQPKPEAATVMVTEKRPEAVASAGSEEYWADYIKIKAAMEVKLEDMGKQLADTKIRMAEMEKLNKELTMKIDELTKERDRVEQAMSIKVREYSIVSRDLVNEREARKIAMNELMKLRGENDSLKREIVLLGKEKMRLQTNIKDVSERKVALENRISGAESIMKEKSLELEELQKELVTTIKGEREITSQESASVELPPIVVKPGSGARGLRGEVLAVNPEEKFVVVNIGEAAGITPGSQLRVLRRNKEVGTIEVIETRKDISAADVKELLAGFTIQEGDTVISK
ncbi:MAG: hypothetical protein WCI77_09760 [Candidatus Omnitrophota bacterium]